MTLNRVNSQQCTCFNDDPMQSCNGEVVVVQVLDAVGLVVPESGLDRCKWGLDHPTWMYPIRI
jgi:hypothetical protein